MAKYYVIGKVSKELLHRMQKDPSADRFASTKKVVEAVNLLKSDEFPPTSNKCENCNYLKKRWNVSQKIS